MNYDIQCYLMKDDGVSSAVNTLDLFPGMYVLEATGLADYGKAKNITTESYAEGEGLVSHIPESIAREATDVTLKLCFFDAGQYGRYRQYDDFVAYMENARVFYWDSVRMRRVLLVLTEKSSPKENFHGQVEYIEAEVKFKNVLGKATDLSRLWSYAWSSPVCVKVDGFNNGHARKRTVTFSNSETGQTHSMSITDVFYWDSSAWPALSNSEYAAMSEEGFSERLSAFGAYAIAYMMEHYGQYSTFAIASISDGADIADTTLCPVS